MSQHRPRQIDRHDLVPDLECERVQIGERDRLVIGGIVDQDIDATEASHHLPYQVIDGRAVRNIAAEGHRVDLMFPGEVTRDGFGLLAALCINDGNMGARPRKRMTDSLPQPTIATGYQRDFPCEIHASLPENSLRPPETWAAHSALTATPRTRSPRPA